MAEGESSIPQVTINPSLGMTLTLKGISSKFNDVSHISTSTLADWLNSQHNKIVLLDTRPEEEYVISHLHGATRVDYETQDVENIIQSLLQLNLAEERDKVKIVCYCSIGYRSSIMAQTLHQYFVDKGNRPEIYNLEGSIFKWANEKRPLIDCDNQPTIFAHPYSGLWGKLLYKELRKQKT